MDEIERLAFEHDRAPLVVPITVTFALTSTLPIDVLREFERLYARLCRMMINNSERPSKRHLLPFCVAWRDDPSTRPDKLSARPPSQAAFFVHPAVASHVHALMIVHPCLVERFLEVRDELPAVWRDIATGRGVGGRPTYRNRSLHLHPEHFELYRRLLDDVTANREVVRGHLRGWVDYASKLEWRGCHDDVFTVLPAVA
jgi:hypothetical protein